jgi:hypothetical protein
MTTPAIMLLQSILFKLVMRTPSIELLQHGTSEAMSLWSRQVTIGPIGGDIFKKPV